MDQRSDCKADIDNVDDGAVKNALVSILDSMKNMENTMKLVNSNFATLNTKADDQSKSIGRIEKQLLLSRRLESACNDLDTGYPIW